MAAILYDLASADVDGEESASPTNLSADQRMVLDFSTPAGGRLTSLAGMSARDACECVAIASSQRMISGGTFAVTEFLKQVAGDGRMSSDTRIAAAGSLSGDDYHEAAAAIMESGQCLPTTTVQLAQKLYSSSEYRDRSIATWLAVIGDRSAPHDFRFRCAAALEGRVATETARKLVGADNEGARLALFERYSELIRREFPKFFPRGSNVAFYEMLLGRVPRGDVIGMAQEEDASPVWSAWLLVARDITFSGEMQVLAAQRVMASAGTGSPAGRDAAGVLAQIATDTASTRRLRADAADTLVSMGSDADAVIGREVIEALGGRGTVYDNTENVHNSEIEKSVGQTLRRLFCDGPNPGRSRLSPAGVLEKCGDTEQVKAALHRIAEDRAIYCVEGTRREVLLSDVLAAVCARIAHSPHQDQLWKRLAEELRDMAGTCSSGCLSRLCNVMSGFAGFGLRISFKDQIKANLAGRLNARARAIKDDFSSGDRLRCVRTLFPLQKDTSAPEVVREFEGAVLSEMADVTHDASQKRHFSLFLRSVIGGIREEMYAEFCAHMDDSTFDLYMREAMCFYEGFRT